MADPELQALLDPGGTGRGVRIQQRVDTGVLSAYYVVSGVGPYQGRGPRWINVTTADSDATKNTAIRTALGIA
jgi:hypothetical protein